jgi:hypothetical protein
VSALETQPLQLPANGATTASEFGGDLEAPRPGFVPGERLSPTGSATAPEAIKSVRGLLIMVSMASGPEKTRRGCG